MRKMIAVFIAAACTGGTALVASAAPALADKPIAAPEAPAPAHTVKKHSAKAAPHQRHVSSKAKKSVKTPHPA
jgi:hypothetical protein